MEKCRSSHRVATLLLVALAVAVAVVFWWLVDPRAPATFISSEIVEAPRIVDGLPAYKGGEMLIVERNRCIRGHTIASVRRFIVDHMVYQLPIVAGVDDVGCATRRYAIQVPTNLPPGPYIYRVYADYDINPVRMVTVTLPDVSFRVVP